MMAELTEGCVGGWEVVQEGWADSEAWEAWAGSGALLQWLCVVCELRSAQTIAQATAQATAHATAQTTAHGHQ
jgi:hypothetical protein